MGGARRGHMFDAGAIAESGTWRRTGWVVAQRKRCSCGGGRAEGRRASAAGRRYGTSVRSTPSRTRSSRGGLNLTTCGSIKQSNCAHFGLWPCQTSTLIASRASARSRAEQRTLPEPARISVQQRHGSLVNQLGAAPKQYVPRPPAATKAPRAAALRRAAAADDESTRERLLICVAVRCSYHRWRRLGFVK